MDKLFLWIMLPIWWLIIVTPDVGAVLEYIFRNTNPLANILWLALILIAARFSELQRLGKLPLFGRAETTEYAVEFDDEITGVWDEDS
jgi:hypothetical protein